MKRFITLILMLTTLLTFTQKVTAFAPLLENKTASMVNCPISMGFNEAQMDMSRTDCGDGMSHTMDCQGDCDFMTVPAVLSFIDPHRHLYQPPLLLTYPTGNAASPYYFPESLYRPPFLS
ncbi:MAG: hypothetical protein ACJAT7_000159 [Psychromonas sp.]|jgi:hypothetical protein|uniref:hypothetical protein n=1 Tax=Psychromonas sp. TaxID=1884585 RepID=UPI0039E624E0